MSGGDVDIFNTVSEEILRWRFLARSQDAVAALNRLTTHPDAKRVWLQLAKKEPKKDSFDYVVSSIGREAVVAHLGSDQRKTQREIREVALEAVALVKRLVHLIENNSSLRYQGIDLMPENERCATLRITRGLANLLHLHRFDENNLGRWFPPEIETMLDEMQIRDFPEFHDMTTFQAHRIISNELIFDQSFLERMKQFAKLAGESGNQSPIVQRPNQPSADQHAFALKVCSIFNYHYGVPNCNLATGIVSAVFDIPVDTENVKKWWQRNGEG